MISNLIQRFQIVVSVRIPCKISLSEFQALMHSVQTLQRIVLLRQMSMANTNDWVSLDQITTRAEINITSGTRRHVEPGWSSRFFFIPPVLLYILKRVRRAGRRLRQRAET